MKKFHLFLMIMTLCLFSACHDELWDKIDDLDGRLTQLEEQCKEMNTNIESLQTIVEALQSNDYITSIVEIKKDGIVIGYSITFANHDAITIYHHKNNLAGALVVDVAQEGGTYYWTVNGEWLEDEDGNKVPVTDENVTPKLKVEDDYWYISLDDGATWIEVCKINEKGDSMFKSVTHDDAYVYFTLANGTVLKVAKSGTGAPAEYIFTITYEANGGEGKAMPVDTVYYGHDVALRSCGYTKEGYMFVEWNTSADGKGAPFKSGHTLRLDRNIVLYAQWKDNGVFTVSASKKVKFSKGNLQYSQSTNTWAFASTQYEMLGIDNVTGGSVSFDYGDVKYGDALADKIDLFGWSTDATNFGVSTSEDNNDYSGSFVDWGTNKIGNDAPNTWRTLTDDEWEYLRHTRTNADNLIGVAQVNGVNGLILLPDEWVCPSDVTFKSGFHSEFGVSHYAYYQTFTLEQWSKMEKAGAVFLPAAGYRVGSSVKYVRNYGRYWSSIASTGYFTYHLTFYSDGASISSSGRPISISVRLVKDF